jgi:hypothetical protein
MFCFALMMMMNPIGSKAYPSEGQLLQQPEDISRVDVAIGRLTHGQCQRLFIEEKELPVPSFNITARRIELNLQSVTTHVDQTLHKVENIVVHADGSQSTYAEQLLSRSFGCDVITAEYDGIFSTAQNAIDEMSYVDADLVKGVPDRDPESITEFADKVTASNISKAMLLFQRGKVLEERYAPGAENSLRSFGTAGGFPFTSMLIGARQQQGMMNLDEFCYCPELTFLEKKARNMTLRNMLAWRIGRPSEKPV